MMGKLTIYGSSLCPDTHSALQLLDEKKIAYEFKNISGELVNLKEFLHVRDTDERFAAIRTGGRIVIPCCVTDQGSVFLDISEIIK